MTTQRSPAQGAGRDRIPARPDTVVPLSDTRKPPEQTAKELQVAWDALDRHRQSAKRMDALYRRDAACANACAQCDLECAVMTAVLWQLWRAHQRALAENGQTLTYGGRCYSTTAGSA